MTHGEEVAGYVAVLRFGMDEAEKAGKFFPRATREALALVERWLAGETVTQDEMLAANKAANEASGRAWNASWEDRSGWTISFSLPLAACNLCCLAGKLPGWKNTTSAILESVRQSLHALETELTVDTTAKLQAKLEEVRRAAMAEAAQRPSIAWLKTPQASNDRKPQPLDPRTISRLGPLAGARLTRLKPRIEPALRGTEEQIRERLGKKNYPVSAALLSLERHWGGTRFSAIDPRSEWNTLIGAYGMLDGYSVDGDERGRVPVAHGALDDTYFMDRDGRVTAAWLDRPEFPWAASGDAMIAKLVLLGFAMSLGHFQQLENQSARELVGTLPPVPEASDDCGGTWGDEKMLIMEVGTNTLVAARQKYELARFLP